MNEWMFNDKIVFRMNEWVFNDKIVFRMNEWMFNDKIVFQSKSGPGVSSKSEAPRPMTDHLSAETKIGGSSLVRPTPVKYVSNSPGLSLSTLSWADPSLSYFSFQPVLHDSWSHGAICHQINLSWWTHWPISHSSQCSTTGVTKAHGAMGHQINPSWWTHWAISCSSQCSTTGVTKAHSAMGHRINPLWWTHWAISRSSQCSTTGVTKAVVCAVLSDEAYKRTLAANRKE